jgi:NADH-quinone oxidoreductase subunit C
MADIPVKPGDELLVAFYARKKAKAEGKDPAEAEKKALIDFLGYDPAAKAAEEAAASTDADESAEIEEEVEVEPPPPPKTPEAVLFFEEEGTEIKREELGTDKTGTYMYEIAVEDMVSTCVKLKESRKFDILNFATAVELKKGYQYILRLESSEHLEAIILKVTVPKTAPHLPTLTNIYASANWQEREAYDMMGLIFDGHPNLVRILNPDKWEGYPLRKDYIQPIDGLNKSISAFRKDVSIVTHR